jgi:putative NADH-flavin reductase
MSQAGEMRKGFAKQGAAIDNLTASTGKQGKEIYDLTSSVAHVVTSIARIEEKMATKKQVVALRTQVNSIERQLRD